MLNNKMKKTIGMTIGEMLLIISYVILAKWWGGIGIDTTVITINALCLMFYFCEIAREVLKLNKEMKRGKNA